MLDTSCEEHTDLRASHFAEFLDELRDECFVSGSQGTDAHHMHVRIYGLLGGFLGGL
jgi:hypothetical protein